jgi:hypothetical protein
MKNYTPIDPKKIKEKFYAKGGAGSKEAFISGFENFDIQPEATIEKKETAEKEQDLISFIEEEQRPPEDLRKAGVKPSLGKIKIPESERLKFPISDEVLWNGLHSPVNTSLRWLSEYLLYVLKKFGLRLEKKNGKVVRVYGK